MTNYKFDDLFGHEPLHPDMVCRIAPTRWERFVAWLKRTFGMAD